MLEYVSMVCYFNNTQVDCVNCMDNFFGKMNKYIFFETGPFSCSDNYVDLRQPLICLAHDTKLLYFASKIDVLFIHICRLTVACV